MKISSHNISFASKHTATTTHVQHERLEVWNGDNPNQSGNGADGSRSTGSVADPPDASSLIEPDRVRTDTSPEKASEETGETDEGSTNPRTQEELELKILIESVSAVMEDTSLEFRDPSLDGVREAYREGEEAIDDIERNQQSRPTPNRERADWGLRYDSYERYEEEESLSFRAEGKVKTEDGETLDFEVSLDMHRKFVRESETHIRAGNAEPIDPLVINFDGKAADLSEEKFSFDLDMDGTLESLNTLETGSGFLAMDKNGNGTIDDGSELFGPSTGNGFKELATYDRDGNRFIDEGDPAYDKLYVMRPTEGGGMEKTSAESLDVGAIFLGSSDTSFSFKNDLELQGQLRRSGIYLKENGETGTVQQVDLVPDEAKTPDTPSSLIDVSG